MVDARAYPTHYEGLMDRLRLYLPSPELLAAYPTIEGRTHELRLRDEFRESLPGAEYSMGFDHQARRFFFMPPWFTPNLTPQNSPAMDYGLDSFDGMSIEPVVKENRLVGANSITHAAKMDRFNDSVGHQPFDLPVSIETISQALLDYYAVLGAGILENSQRSKSDPRNYSRAYGRPNAFRGGRRYGLMPKPGDEMLTHVSGIAWNWPAYFDNPQEVYYGEGLTVVATGAQRITPINGKHSYNYGGAVGVAKEAKNHGGTEAVFLSPFTVDDSLSFEERAALGKQAITGQVLGYADDASHEKMLKKAAIADGSGEDLCAIDDQGRVIFMPKWTNILAGTTRGYIKEHMMPAMDIPTLTAPITLDDLRAGKIKGLSFMGNAARFAPIKCVRVLHADGHIEEIPLEVTPLQRSMVDRFERELSGLIEPSHPSLLTPINLEGGAQARAELDKIFKEWR